MDKTKTRHIKDTIDDRFEITETDLESTLESYLQNEEIEEKPRLLNFFSMTGLVMLTVGFLSVVQLILPISFDFTVLLKILPIFGGILALFYGLGLFSSERRKNKRKDKKNRELKEKTKALYTSANRGSKLDLDTFALKTKKKLFKSQRDKKIFGVCAGIADYLGIDPTMIRILFVVFFLIGYGTPSLIYVLLGFILDKEPPLLDQ